MISRLFRIPYRGNSVGKNIPYRGKYSIQWGKVWGISAECVDKSGISNTITCCVEKRVEEPIGMI